MINYILNFFLKKKKNNNNKENQIKKFTHDYEEEENKRMELKKKQKEEEEKNNLEEPEEPAEEIEVNVKVDVEEKQKELPKPTIPIAPDGYIPNSIIMKVIHEWRKKHPNFTIDYLNNKEYGTIYNLLKVFDSKINNIDNIENENELIREFIEIFREMTNKKKQEEIEKKKQNNIKLHTEFSSFMQTQSSIQQNRFLNKYFNGIMPSIDSDEEDKEDKEEQKKKQDEKEAKKAEEKTNRSKPLNSINGDKKSDIQAVDRTNTSMTSKNMTRTSTLIGSSIIDCSNKSLATKYLNDEIDLKDKTIEVINENLEDADSENSNLEDDDSKMNKENEDGDDSENEENESNKVDSNDEEEDGESEEEGEEEEEEEEEEGSEKEEEKDDEKNSTDDDSKKEESGKQYLYYSEEDIPDEVKKLIETFWFPKYLVNAIDKSLLLIIIISNILVIKK